MPTTACLGIFREDQRVRKNSLAPGSEVGFRSPTVHQVTLLYVAQIQVRLQLQSGERVRLSRLPLQHQVFVKVR